jgi:hypothetical protein
MFAYEYGTENTASFMEQQGDKCCNKEENGHEGHLGSGSQSQVVTVRQCG